MPPPIVGLIDPNYYPHVNGILHAQTEREIAKYAHILGRVVCFQRPDWHIGHVMTYIKNSWSDSPRTDGSLGWLPFISVTTCSIVLKNESRISMQFLCPNYTVTLKPGDYVMYGSDTAPYREVSHRDSAGDYMALNVQYMFIPNWLPLPVFHMYKWLCENTKWLQTKCNGVYLTALLLCKWANIT